jgi:rare lipoprotein A
MTCISSWKIASVCLAFFALSSAAEAKSEKRGAASDSGVSQSGRASWYGPGFHGRRTASGERFNAGAYTAAHRHLPFGTRLRVVNKANGRAVVVRVNDRGPFHGGRILDLSHASARAIGLSGVASVAISRI